MAEMGFQYLHRVTSWRSFPFFIPSSPGPVHTYFGNKEVEVSIPSLEIHVWHHRSADFGTRRVRRLVCTFGVRFPCCILLTLELISM